MFGKDEYKQAGSAFVFLGLNLTAWVIVLIVLTLGITAVSLGVEKWRQNKLTEITRQTNQYVTTQQTMLSTWAIEYRNNESKAAEAGGDVAVALYSQNKALCERMQMTAARIDPQYIPAAASSILLGGCK